MRRLILACALALAAGCGHRNCAADIADPVCCEKDESGACGVGGSCHDAICRGCFNAPGRLSCPRDGASGDILCVDPATDPANCGGCGNACAPLTRCQDGQCRPAP